MIFNYHNYKHVSRQKKYNVDKVNIIYLYVTIILQYKFALVITVI